MHSIKNIHTKKRGFTLLELLVVVSIIGILIAMGSVAFSAAQKRGRDARRQADMKAIQNAMEQAYAETNNYPAAANITSIQTALTGYFSGAFPTDPKTAYVGSSSTTAYCVCADLESGSGNFGSSACAAGTGFYCVKNLQ